MNFDFSEEQKLLQKTCRDYLDDNAYANDEFTQFMNGGLVNSLNAFLPSFDIGSAAQVDIGAWSVRGVVMDIGERSRSLNAFSKLVLSALKISMLAQDIHNS